MTIQWKDRYVQIPNKGISGDLAEEIINLLPIPEDKLGWKFDEYVVRSLSQINFKDKAGNSDNPVRVGGTKGKESLEVSLARGMDVNEHTPSLYPNDNIFDGATRLKYLKKMGKEQYIFSTWIEDDTTKTKYQSSKEDCIEDSRMNRNADNGKRPATDDDILELVRRRMKGKRWDKKDIKGYLNTLDLNLSGSKIDGLANVIDRDRRRKGVIESYDSTTAHEYVEKKGGGAIVVNTKSGASTELQFIAMMKSVVASKTPAQLVTYSSSACSHDEIDKHYDETVEKMGGILELCRKFVKTCDYYELNSPYDIKGSIPQKIVKDKKMPDGFVQYGTPPSVTVV